jgi:hypothetical protein
MENCLYTDFESASQNVWLIFIRTESICHKLKYRTICNYSMFPDVSKKRQ